MPPQVQQITHDLLRPCGAQLIPRMGSGFHTHKFEPSLMSGLNVEGRIADQA